jgi:RNA-splicing ligase RtcB
VLSTIIQENCHFSIKRGSLRQGAAKIPCSCGSRADFYKAAFERLSMEEYTEQMSDVYSTCVVPDTIDESPMAYKNMDEIIEQIEPTATIVSRIKPVYNFKAAE